MRRHLIAFDLEATCWTEPPLSERQSTETEIIEIGAVRIHPQTLQETSRFETVVRPSRHPALSAYCTSLTNIRQAEVDGAQTFPVAWRSFREWLGEPSECEMLSWGPWDIQQIEREIEAMGEDRPDWCYTDAQGEYVRWCRARRLTGRSRKLMTVAQDLGLMTGETEHRALADAARLAQVVARMRDPEGRTDAADALLDLLKRRLQQPTHRGHARRELGMDKGTYTAAASELIHLQLAVDLGDGRGLHVRPDARDSEKTITTML